MGVAKRTITTAQELKCAQLYLRMSLSFVTETCHSKFMQLDVRVTWNACNSTCALLEIRLIQSARYLKYVQLEVRVTVMLSITQTAPSSKCALHEERQSWS